MIAQLVCLPLSSPLFFSLYSVLHPAAVCGRPEREETVHDFAGEIQDLCVFVYRHGTRLVTLTYFESEGMMLINESVSLSTVIGEARQKMVAMLCQISHHALHDRFFEVGLSLRASNGRLLPSGP